MGGNREEGEGSERGTSAGRLWYNAIVLSQHRAWRPQHREPKYPGQIRASAALGAECLPNQDA